MFTPIDVVISPDDRTVLITSYHQAATPEPPISSWALFRRDSRSGSLAQVTGAGGCVVSSAVAGCTEWPELSTVQFGAAGSPVFGPGGSALHAFAGDAVWAFTVDPRAGLRRVSSPAGCWSASARAGCARARGIAPRDADDFESAAPILEPSPDGRNLYVGSDAGLAAFAVEPRTGGLSQLRGGRGCLVWSQPRSARQSCARHPRLGGEADLTVSVDGRTVYASAQGSRDSTESGDTVVIPATLTTLKRDRRSGGLSPVRGGCLSSDDDEPAPPRCRLAPFTWDAFGLLLPRDGRAMYVVGDERIAVLERDRRTGAVSPVRRPFGCIGGRAGPRDCLAAGAFEDAVLSPDGRQLYTVDPDAAIRIWRRAR